MVTDGTDTSHSPHLPRHLTALVGRTTELAQIRQKLLDPACRLLTLFGPGGMGKTRLAIEVARRVAPDLAREVGERMQLQRDGQLFLVLIAHAAY